MPDEMLTRLHRELEPDDTTIAGLRSRLLEEMDAVSSTDLAEMGPRPARRRHRVRSGAVFAGAAGLALVVALSPFEPGDERSVVPAPATARAALERAAVAAAAAPWRPLGADEYHHTMTTTFVPDIPARPGDPQEKINQMFTMQGPTSEEAWIGRDGRGLSIDVQGGNGDPDLYPVVQADGGGWQPTFGRRYPEHEEVDVDVSLRRADLLTITRSLPGNRADYSLWYRTPDGYERRRHAEGQPYPTDYTSFVQARHWDATIDQVDAVNDASDGARPAAIERLLASSTPGFQNAGSFGRVGQYGVTTQTKREDEQIVRAIELLGSAPLSPDVRRDLFEWLSRRPTARLEGVDDDVLGRRGTRVTFERIFDEVVPGELVTVADLKAQARRRGEPVPTGPVRGPQAVRVEDDHQFRRFYVTILFDPDSGELLEHVVYGRVEATAQRPRLQQQAFVRRGTVPRPSWRVALSVDRQGVSDAALYGIRERTTAFSNVRSEACRVTPPMCEG